MSRHPRPQIPRRLGFIGAGRAGTALAWHCKKAGFCITGLADSVPSRARAARRLLKLPLRPTTPAEVAADSDVVFFTVPDAAIARVYRSLRPGPGTLVVHCSGALGTEVFRDADRVGLETLALHPLQVFSGRSRPIQSLEGSWWTLDGSRPGLAFGRSLVRRLHGRSVVVKQECRPAYHAACVFVSNFQAALLDSAERLGACLGIGRSRVPLMLAPLARAALDSVLQHGPTHGLTGPVERGDCDTIRQHLDALSRHAPELLPVYRELSLRLVELVRRKGMSRAGVRRLRALLEAK